MVSDKYAKLYEGPKENNQPYEDTNFQAGDSPTVLDVFTDLARTDPIYNGEIDCDGPGDILVATSNDGTTYSGNHRLKSAETFVLTTMEMKKVKITHSGTDSAWRARFW